jgi:hypothetical protein
MWVRRWWGDSSRLPPRRCRYLGVWG